MDFKTVKSLDVNNKVILLRADLNVPRQGNRVTETSRISRLKPTIQYLHEKGARVLIISHFGRPNGAFDPDMSLKFLTPTLEEEWGLPVRFCSECVGETAQNIARATKAGDIVLMENIRFNKLEKQNDPEFSKALASLGDIYVNDAFSVSHRCHSSTSGICEYLPSVAGLLMEEELNALSRALEKPEKPVLAVTGGSKISSKLGVLENLIEKVDFLVLGGGMANTFLYAKGVNMGSSLCEKDMKDTATDIMNKAEKIGCEIILPLDVVVTKELKKDTSYETVDVNAIPADQMAIDIGEKTISYICEKIEKSKTVVWNGPMGVFEIKPFDHGTNMVANCVTKQTAANECVSIAGGGDTVAALENANAIEGFSYISTAGGAFLEWLEGKELPGVIALRK